LGTSVVRSFFGTSSCSSSKTLLFTGTLVFSPARQRRHRFIGPLHPSPSWRRSITCPSQPPPPFVADCSGDLIVDQQLLRLLAWTDGRTAQPEVGPNRAVLTAAESFEPRPGAYKAATTTTSTAAAATTTTTTTEEEKEPLVIVVMVSTLKNCEGPRRTSTRYGSDGSSCPRKEMERSGEKKCGTAGQGEGGSAACRAEVVRPPSTPTPVKARGKAGGRLWDRLVRLVRRQQQHQKSNCARHVGSVLFIVSDVAS
jgi:hypothetical protein